MTETRVKLSVYLPVEKVKGVQLFNHLNNKKGVVYEYLDSYTEEGEEHILSFIYIENETTISEEFAYAMIKETLEELNKDISFQLYEVMDN